MKRDVELLEAGVLLVLGAMALLWAAVSNAQPSSLNGQPLTAVLCDGGVVCSRRGSVATIIVTATSGGGGGGSVNTATGSVSFDGGSRDARATVSAAWATGASVITCAPTGEEASVEGLVVTVLSKGSGTFTVRAEPRNGTHLGSLPFECIGN